MGHDKQMTYHNFSNMCDHVIEEIYEAGVVEKLDFPMQMNRYSEECQLREAFGYKVTNHIKLLTCVLQVMELEEIPIG